MGVCSYIYFLLKGAHCVCVRFSLCHIPSWTFFIFLNIVTYPAMRTFLIKIKSTDCLNGSPFPTNRIIFLEQKINSCLEPLWLSSITLMLSIKPVQKRVHCRTPYWTAKLIESTTKKSSKNNVFNWYVSILDRFL